MAPRTRLKSLHRLVERMMSVCWDTIQKVVPSQCTPDAHIQPIKNIVQIHSLRQNRSLTVLWDNEMNHDRVSTSSGLLWNEFVME